MIDGEEKLIQDAVKEGDSSAFGKLYDHYQPMIYRFVFIKVGRREEAEDITHQVFLRAWQNIQELPASRLSFRQLVLPDSPKPGHRPLSLQKEEVPLDPLIWKRRSAKSTNPILHANRHGTGYGGDSHFKTGLSRRDYLPFC